MIEKLLEFAPFALPLLIAITFHEAAHGYVAYKFGDTTAKMLGRVTFNPLRHIDVNGTILIPTTLAWMGSPALFGYAKPVPVNFSALRGGAFAVIAVAAAGPMINILLAIISALSLHLENFLAPELYQFLFQSLYISVMVNVVLAVFNMLPILPLDGGRILNALLPTTLRIAHAKTERFGMVVILLLFLLPPLLKQLYNVDIPISYYLLYIPASILHTLVLWAVGIG